MKYQIIGFNDVVDKPRGPAQRFKPEHRFFADELPTEEALRKYALNLGYLPRKGRGISQTKCAPVYYYNTVPAK